MCRVVLEPHILRYEHASITHEGCAAAVGFAATQHQIGQVALRARLDLEQPHCTPTQYSQLRRVGATQHHALGCRHHESGVELVQTFDCNYEGRVVRPDMYVPLQAGHLSERWRRRRRLWWRWRAGRLRRLDRQRDVATDARRVAADRDVVIRVRLGGQRQPRVERLAALLAKPVAIARNLLELVEALQLPAARDVEYGEVGVEAHTRLAAARRKNEHHRLRHSEAHPHRGANTGEACVRTLRHIVVWLRGCPRHSPPTACTHIEGREEHGNRAERIGAESVGEERGPARQPVGLRVRGPEGAAAIDGDEKGRCRDCSSGRRRGARQAASRWHRVEKGLMKACIAKAAGGHRAQAGALGGERGGGLARGGTCVEKRDVGVGDERLRSDVSVRTAGRL
eukprot:1168964-Prymnesium_polylepis.1